MNKEMQDRVLTTLRAVLATDADALRDLFEYRVLVSDAFMERDEPIVVHAYDDDGNEAPPKLGVLGLINGILGHDFKICAVYEDDGTVSGVRPL